MKSSDAAAGGAGKSCDMRPAGDGVFERRAFFGPGRHMDPALRGEVPTVVPGGVRSRQSRDIERPLYGPGPWRIAS